MAKKRNGAAYKAASSAVRHSVMVNHPDFGHVYIDAQGKISTNGPAKFTITEARELAAKHEGRVVNH